MEGPPPTQSYLRDFVKSPHHVIFGLLTLGAGFISAVPIALIAGATAYLLGWIYLPDADFFKSWVDRRRRAAEQSEELRRLEQFLARRNALILSLSPERQDRYQRLAGVCRDIESAGGEGLPGGAPTNDPRMRKIDELMWTYLRLLGIEESLRRFLDTEGRENVPAMLEEAEAEARQLDRELEELKAKGVSPALENRQRYLSSRLERLEVLRKRRDRIQQAQDNLALVVSEQERLDQQIKLIRADAVAAKNAENLTARIDATVQHLDQTNKWLSELDEFKDLVEDMPVTEVRVGYEPGPAPEQKTSPPVISAANPNTPRRVILRQRQ